MKSFFTTFLKGFAMGAANVVPGVSGGTIALLTGIYNKIVGSLNSMTDKSTWKALLSGRFKEFWSLVGGNFLVSLCLGIGASILSLAKAITWAMEYYPILSWAFFFGLIIASAYVMFRGIGGWNFKSVLFVSLGIAMGIIVCTLTPTETPDSMLFIFVCGAVAICTMILPGISGSFVLLILGKYEYIMNAVDTMDIAVLAVFGLGCVIGILAFAKLLHYLLERWEHATMLVLLGFVTGSLVKVWPWADKASIQAAQLLRSQTELPTDLQIPGAVISCLAGIALVILIELLAGKAKTQS